MAISLYKRDRTNYLEMNKRVTQANTDIAAKAAAVIPTYTVAAVPAAASNTGKMIRVSNGDAGSPCLAVSNGTNWLRVVYGAAVAAS